MWRPLQLPDGTKFGVLAPPRCPLRSAEVTSAGTINPSGVAEATFLAVGFSVKSVFSPAQLFSPRGFPVRISLVTTSAEACHDLSLMPAAGLPNSDGFELESCNRGDIDDRWVECGKRTELYVRGPAARTELIGFIEPRTAIIPLVARDGWTQVSPFEPVPFRLNDGWTWWMRTSALEGCHQPR